MNDDAEIACHRRPTFDMQNRVTVGVGFARNAHVHGRLSRVSALAMPHAGSVDE